MSGWTAEEAKRSVLIVDDEEGILDSLETALEDEFSVLRARNAAEAMRILARDGASLVFLDLMMPGRNGFHLMREIRQMELPARVVMLTAAAGEEWREEARSLGADAWMRKPFDVDNIIATARTLSLPGRRAATG